MRANKFFQFAFLGIIIPLVLCGNSLYAQTLELEFERELTVEEQILVNESITQRLDSGKIEFKEIVLIDNQSLHVEIRSENEVDRAMKLLAPQGLFSVMEVFDNGEMINALIEFDDELRFNRGLESSILDFLILIDPNDENMPFANTKTVIGFCNPEDTVLLMQLLKHPGIKEMLPAGRVFRWMKEHHDGKLQLVALKLADERMQINQDYISSVSTGENHFGQNSLFIGLNQNGAKNFREVTNQNIGKHLAVLLDNVIHSTPAVVSPVHSGRLDINQLSGEELDIYCNTLSAGRSYPAKLTDLRLK